MWRWNILRAVLVGSIVFTGSFNLDGRFDFYDFLTPIVFIVSILVELRIRKNGQN